MSLTFVCLWHLEHREHFHSACRDPVLSHVMLAQVMIQIFGQHGPNEFVTVVKHSTFFYFGVQRKRSAWVSVFA